MAVKKPNPKRKPAVKAKTKAKAKVWKPTAKQERFIEYYQLTLNATKAAIMAGYSKKTAYAIGAENLRKPEIMALLEKSREAWEEATGIRKEDVLNELAAIGFANIGTFLRVGDDDVDINLSEATEDELKSLNTVEITTVIHQAQDNSTTETVKKKIRLHDKRQALENIGKHLGMFKDVVEVDIKAIAVPIIYEVKPAKGKVRVTKTKEGKNAE